MNTKRIGIILVALAILTALIVPANAATIRFVPDPSSAATDGTVWVKMYVDLPPGETLLSWQAQILIDPDHADVLAVSKNCDPTADDTCFNTVGKNLTYTCNGYVWTYAAGPREWVYDPDEGEYVWKCPPLGYFTGPRTIKLCRYRVLANGTPGVSPFNFGDEYHPSDCPICMESGLFNSTSLRHDNETWMDSTFYHSPVISSCDSTGNAVDEFMPNEKVYVVGYGLTPSMSLDLWIQNTSIEENDLLVAVNDPSGAQEDVTTDGAGNFGPTEIWDDVGDGAPQYYDIVADNEDGTYNAANDYLDDALSWGFMAPVPELPAVALVLVGLLGLIGAIWRRRYD